MVDVLAPKDENELAGDRGLSPSAAPQAAPPPATETPTEPSVPTETATPQPGTTESAEGIPTGDITEFLPQPVPLQFEQVPQPGYRGDLINSFDPEGEIQEELLQRQAQHGQSAFTLGLEGLEARPERLAEAFDWTKGRPIEQIREELDIPHHAGLQGQGFNFLPGSGEISERSDSVSSDLALAYTGAQSELGQHLQNSFDPERKFNTSRGILDFFTAALKFVTGVDAKQLTTPEYYRYKATPQERELIDKARSGDAGAARGFVFGKVLERLDRQYADDQIQKAYTGQKAKGIEPRELNFNLFKGNFGDFGNAGLLSSAMYLLNLPENIVMAAAGELVEVFNENIPGRERNRFLEALKGRDMGIFEQRTSDFKIFSILEPEDLKHGVKVSDYEELTGRTIPPILQSLWDSPEAIQEEYAVSKHVAKIPYFLVAGAGLIASASVDDLFYKPLTSVRKSLTGATALEALERDTRRLARVGYSPDAPDFTPAFNEAVTKVADIPDQKLLPPGLETVPNKGIVADYISKKFGAERVPPVLYEDLGEFKVLEWRDKLVPERVIKVSDAAEPNTSLDLYVRQVMEKRPIGASLSPTAEQGGRLVVRSSDALTETVVLLEKELPVEKVKRLLSPDMTPRRTGEMIIHKGDRVEFFDYNNHIDFTVDGTFWKDPEEGVKTPFKELGVAFQKFKHYLDLPQNDYKVFTTDILATSTEDFQAKLRTYQRQLGFKTVDVSGLPDDLTTAHPDQIARAQVTVPKDVEFMPENTRLVLDNRTSTAPPVSEAQAPTKTTEEWTTLEAHVQVVDELEELKTEPATTRNVSRSTQLQEKLEQSAHQQAAVVPAESIAPPSKPSEILKEVSRNPNHRVATQDVNTVKRTNAELTWVAKHHINPDTGKPFVNPNRKTPLSTAQLDQLNREYGDLFNRYGAKVDPSLSVATHVEVEPGDIRKLRRAPETIEAPSLHEEIIKKPTAVDYERLRSQSITDLGKVTNSAEFVAAKADFDRKLDRLKASMEPDELFKVEAKHNLPERLTADSDLGAKFVELQQKSKALRSSETKLTEELQSLNEIVTRSERDYDHFRQYSRKDIGSDIATRQHYESEVPSTKQPLLREDLPDTELLPNLSEDRVVFFGSNSPDDIRLSSIDEVETNDLGLGLLGFTDSRLADSYTLRTRQLNAIPMGQGKPKVYAVNTSKLQLLDGLEKLPKFAKEALIDAIDTRLGKGTAETLIDINADIGDLLTTLKSSLANTSELDYRTIIDALQTKLYDAGYDGIVHRDIYSVWNPEKFQKLEVKSLPEPSLNVARLADHTIDAHLDQTFGTLTTAANKSQSFHELARSQYDDIAARLAEVQKSQVDLNREIIETEARLRKAARTNTKSKLKNLEAKSIEDLDDVRGLMKPDYPDPC